METYHKTSTSAPSEWKTSASSTWNRQFSAKEYYLVHLLPDHYLSYRLPDASRFTVLSSSKSTRRGPGGYRNFWRSRDGQSWAATFAAQLAAAAPALDKPRAFRVSVIRNTNFSLRSALFRVLIIENEVLISDWTIVWEKIYRCGNCRRIDGLMYTLVLTLEQSVGKKSIVAAISAEWRFHWATCGKNLYRCGNYRTTPQVWIELQFNFSSLILTGITQRYALQEFSGSSHLPTQLKSSSLEIRTRMDCWRMEIRRSISSCCAEGWRCTEQFEAIIILSIFLTTCRSLAYKYISGGRRGPNLLCILQHTESKSYQNLISS